MMDNKVLYSKIPFRIQIGVTGHHFLPFNENLCEKIKEVIDSHIFKLFDEKSKKVIDKSSNTKIAYNVITALNEGADRMIINEILKIKGTTLEAVLPFVKEDYLKDFKTDESKRQFEALFKKIRRHIVLKKQTLIEEFPDGDFLRGRNKAYQNAGRYIVNHCDVLIALWNGIESKDKGGTAETIAYAKEKKVPVIIISTNEPYEIIVVPADGIDASSFIEIDTFNSFPVSEKQQRRYINKINRDYFDFKESKVLSENVRNSIHEKILPLYVRTSLIASRNHKFYRYTGFYAYIFSSLAVSIIAFGTLFLVGSYVPFILELALLLGVFIFVFFANRKKAHQRWIENRFLAERIWSGVFLALCGIEVSTVRVPPHLGTDQQLGNWILMVFDEMWGLLPPLEKCTDEYCNHMSMFVGKSWLRTQINYHKERAHKAEKMNKILEIGGMSIFIVALIAPLMHLVLFKPMEVFKIFEEAGLAHFFEKVGLYRFIEEEHVEKLLEEILLFVALSLPAVGAAIEGIRSHMEYSRLAARNENMEIALKRLDNRLKKASDPEAIETLLRETEEIILLETQDWLTLISFCKPEYVA